jgi:hypothetical protein
MLGVRRTTVTLVAGRLEAAGVVKCRRGSVQIISEQELEQYSCECYDRVKGYMASLFPARPQKYSGVRRNVGRPFEQPSDLRPLAIRWLHHIIGERRDRPIAPPSFKTNQWRLAAFRSPCFPGFACPISGAGVFTERNARPRLPGVLVNGHSSIRRMVVFFRSVPASVAGAHDRGSRKLNGILSVGDQTANSVDDETANG